MISPYGNCITHLHPNMTIFLIITAYLISLVVDLRNSFFDKTLDQDTFHKAAIIGIFACFLVSLETNSINFGIMMGALFAMIEVGSVFIQSVMLLFDGGKVATICHYPALTRYYSATMLALFTYNYYV